MVVVLTGSARADAATIAGNTRVIDGNTIDVGVARIRLHGIDAPEAGLPCGRANGGEWQCGTASADRLAELIDGSRVECEALDRDQYGRVIGRCFRDGIGPLLPADVHPSEFVETLVACIAYRDDELDGIHHVDDPAGEAIRMLDPLE